MAFRGVGFWVGKRCQVRHEAAATATLPDKPYLIRYGYLLIRLGCTFKEVRCYPLPGYLAWG